MSAANQDRLYKVIFYGPLAVTYALFQHLLHIYPKK